MSKKLENYLKDQAVDINNVFVYGRNKYANVIARLIDIQAYVDDYSVEKNFLGKSVVKLTDLPKDAFVINCSYSMFPVSVDKRLTQQGTRHVNVSELLCKHVISIENDFFQVAQEDIETNAAAYKRIRDRLADKESIDVWDNLISYRLTGDLAFMQSYEVDQDGQYFADFIQPDAEVFADLGAFDGKTTELFIAKCPNYKAVHLFEPAKSNMDQAKSRLSSFSSIYYHQLGVSDRQEQLTFASDAGSACKVSSEGDEVIYLDSLDNMVSDAISFIKIDIEGFERQALQGAKRHIRHNHPLMAIAVYHFPNDLWQIPELVFSFRQDYEIRIRHYTEGTDETIMYFIPKRGAL